MSTNTLNEYASSILYAYRISATEATKSLMRNWLIVPASCCAFGAFILTITIFGQMGITGGLLAGLVQILLISVYYCWIHDTIERDRITLQTIVRLDGGLFSAVINTAFILFIFKFISTSLISGLGLNWIPILMQFGIVVLLNALPEMVYFHRRDGMTSLSETFKFTRDNWIEWFLPLIIILLPYGLVTGVPYLLSQMSRMNEMIPASIVFIVAMDAVKRIGENVPFIGIVGLLVGAVSLNWFMLFRGFLFKELESGSRRQRVYKARQR